MVSASNKHGRGVHWIRLCPLVQVTGGTFESHSDTLNLFNLVKASK